MTKFICEQEIRDQLDLTTILKIGEGSYSNVYKCFSIKENDTIILKEGINNFGIENNKREYDIISLMNLNPFLGIPKVFFSSGNILGLSLIEGITLEDCLTNLKKNKQTFSDEKILAITRKLLNILDFIHSCGVYHRDIKPENIMINTSKGDGDFNVYIIDFGLAVRSCESKISMNAGSPIYMAPEILIDVGKTRSMVEKSDIWSLGITLVEFVLQEHPYPDFSYRDMKDARVKITNIIYTMNVSLPLVNEKLKNTILKMITVSYNKRPTAKESLQSLE